MPPQTIICPVCGIEAVKMNIDGKPRLEVDANAFEACVEQSIAPEPFRCPNMFSAAMDARWIARDGSWTGCPA